jgi:hypothetical protein
MKKRGLVVYEIDLENPPPLSAARRRELKKLAERPDEEIGFSEIPLATEKFWKNAVRNPFLPVKKQVTVRVPGFGPRAAVIRRNSTRFCAMLCFGT